MADYGSTGGGNSLRDALNQLFPMTGLGEYGAGYPPTMFPPAGGADRPTGPVPIPQPRPPQAPSVAPGMMAPGGVPPGLAQMQQPGLIGQYGAPQSYAARLGLGIR